MSIQYPLLIGPAALGDFFDATQGTLDDVPERLDATNEYSSMIFCINQTKPVNDVGLYIAGVSGTASSYLVNLETLDSTGVPSGANYGGSSGTVYQCNQFVKGWNWISLSTPATGTAGNLVAARIRCLGGASASDYLLIGSNKSYQSELPRNRVTSNIYYGQPTFAIRYNDGVVQGWPVNGYTRPYFAASSNPDEMGMKFTVPMPMTCEGARILADFDANASFRVLFYQENSVIRVVNVDDEDYIAGSVLTNTPMFKVYWPTVDLQEDVNYRLTIQPTGLNTRLYEYTLVTGTYNYIYPGGPYFSETYRTDSGSFSDDSQKLLWMSLLVSHINPASTGTSTTTTIIAGEGAHAWAY